MLTDDLKNFRPSHHEDSGEFALFLIGAAAFGWSVIYVLARVFG